MQINKKLFIKIRTYYDNKDYKKSKVLNLKELVKRRIISESPFIEVNALFTFSLLYRKCNKILGRKIDNARSLLLRQRFKWYRCVSDLPLYKWRVS